MDKLDMIIKKLDNMDAKISRLESITKATERELMSFRMFFYECELGKMKEEFCRIM